MPYRPYSTWAYVEVAWVGYWIVPRTKARLRWRRWRSRQNRSKSRDDVEWRSFPSDPYSAYLHLSWQVGTGCLFETNARRVRIEQYVRISGFNIDVTALFRDDIQQGGATVTVGLADKIQIVSRLVAHTAPVNRNPRLCSAEPDEILCDLMPKIQVDRCNLAARSLYGRRVRRDHSLIAIEDRQIDVESENDVVESLAYRAKISCCVEGSLRKATVRTLVTAEHAGVRFSLCLIGTKLCIGQPFVRPLEGQVGAMIHRQL